MTITTFMDNALLNAIINEIRDGLPKERKQRLDDAQINNHFYLGEFEAYRYRVDAWDQQSDQHSLFMQRAVNVLTKYLYKCDPLRTIPGNEIATEFLAEVYRTNNGQALWQQADRLSAVNQVAAVQVGLTDDDEKPVRLTLWSGDEFAVFSDPDDNLSVAAIATIEVLNADQTRYRLFTRETIYTFLTDKFELVGTTGGRIAKLVGEEENPFGFIPFSFVHYQYPTRDFWCGSPGHNLRVINDHLNFRLTRGADAARYLLKPILVGKNLPPEMGNQGQLKPGEICNLKSKNRVGDSSNDPSLDQLAPDTSWVDAELKLINFTIDHTLEMHGIPASAFRMEQSQVKSGVALVYEQIPLLDWAKSRQQPFSYYEQALARLICKVGMVSPLVPAKTRNALARADRDFRLDLLWHDPFDLGIPDPSETDMALVDAGMMSKTQAVMRRFSLSRDQALAYLRQVAEDREDEANILVVEAKEPLTAETAPEQVPTQDQNIEETYMEDVNPDGNG